MTDIGEELKGLSTDDQRKRSLLLKLRAHDPGNLLSLGDGVDLATQVVAFYRLYPQHPKLADLTLDCLEVCLGDAELFTELAKLIVLSKNSNAMMTLIEFLWEYHKSSKYGFGIVLIQSGLIRCSIEKGSSQMMGLISRLTVTLFESEDRINTQQVYTLLTSRILLLIREIRESGKVFYPQNELLIITVAMHRLCVSTNSFLVITLSPSLPRFLLCEIDIEDENLIRRCGTFHFQILCLGFNFCKTHGFFIGTSSYLNKKSLIESPSSNFLQLQLKTLGKLLFLRNVLPVATLDLCLEWVFIISNQLGLELLNTEEMVCLRKSVLLIFLNGHDPVQSRINRLVDDLHVFSLISQFELTEMDNVMAKIVKMIPDLPTLHKQIPIEVMLTYSLRSIPIEFAGSTEKWLEELNRVFGYQTEKKVYLHGRIRAIISDVLAQASLKDDCKDGSLNELLRKLNSNMLSMVSPTSNADMGRRFMLCHALMELIEQTETTGDVGNGKAHGFLKVFDISYEVLSVLFDSAIDVGRPEFIVMVVLDYCKRKSVEENTYKLLLTHLTWAYILLEDIEGISDVECALAIRFKETPKFIAVAREFAAGRVELCMNLVDILDIDDIEKNPVLYKMINWIRRECLLLVPIPQIRRHLAPNAFHNLAECNETLDSTVLMNLINWNLPVEGRAETSIQRSLDNYHSDVKQLLQSWLKADQFYANPLKSIFEIENKLTSLISLVYGNGPKAAWKGGLDALQTLFKVLESDINWNSVDAFIDSNPCLSTKPIKTFTFVQTLSTYFEKSMVIRLQPSPKFYLWLSTLAQQSGNQMLLYYYSDKSLKMNPQRLYAETQMSYLLRRIKIAKTDTAVPQNVLADGVKLFSLFCQTLGSHGFDVEVVSHSANKLAWLATRKPELPDLLKIAVPTKLQQSIDEVATLSSSPESSNLSGALYHLATTLNESTVKFYKDFYGWVHQQSYTERGLLRIRANEFNQLKELAGFHGVKLTDSTIREMETASSYSSFLQVLTRKSTLDPVEFTSNDVLTTLWSSIKERQKALFGIAVKTLVGILSHEATVNITAIFSSLELLKLMVLHSNWFSAYEEFLLSLGLSKAWLEVIPQIIGAARHKDEVCSEMVQKLLKLLVDRYPDHFAYPLLSVRDHISNREYSVMESPTEEDGISLASSVYELKQSFESGCLKDIVYYFKSTQSQLSSEANGLLSHFDNFSLTTSERWHYFLSHLNTDVVTFRKALKSYSHQLEKVISEKERIKKILSDVGMAFRDTVHTLICRFYEELDDIGHEKEDSIRFKAFFKLRIENAILESSICSSIDSFFRPFSPIIQSLCIDIQRQDNHNFLLSTLSTELASINNSVLPLPGFQRKHWYERRTIYSFGDTVHILPTKTRPKKLSILDNHGDKHIYLCKGQEDLRLDERISGLLNLCNEIFHPEKQGFECRRYSVTPLSDRTGLIEWVSGASSVYQIYKEWHLAHMSSNFIHQNRDFNRLSEYSDSGGEVCNNHQSQSEDEHPSNIVVEEESQLNGREFRPVKQFYSVLKELLPVADRGFNHKNRTLWTNDILLKTYKRLKETAPTTVISDFLRKSSTNSLDWLSKVNNYTKSISTANTIGSLVDLGDRHLDNILIDPANGDLIHVDFNVCFNKGNTLRVPERVPFRLTSNFVDVLGLAGVEGKYRLSSEHILEFLRSNKNVIVNFLQVFQTDPLNEWLVPNDPFSGSKLSLFNLFFINDSKILVNMMLKFFVSLLKTLESTLDVSRQNIEKALKEMIDHNGRETKISDFHELIGYHQRIMKFLKPFLKILSVCFPEFNLFLTQYKSQFSSPMAKILRKLMSDHTDVPSDLIYGVILESPRLYHNLISLEKVSLESLQEQDRIFLPNKVPAKLLERVLGKLNGIESDSGSMMTVSQQVEYLLYESTNESNLSSMYEGWMPWI